MSPAEDPTGPSNFAARTEAVRFMLLLKSMTDRPLPTALAPSDTFAHRHIGPRPSEIEKMLETLGFESLEALVDSAVPRSIRLSKPLSLDGLPAVSYTHLTLPTILLV